ncbi:hypothetical protein DH2020_043053 [Rehmannia glutinosa]|uniref:CCT domain-containing protein n=1 Tax=Rehmannia glutinosa TaxID=99300 RepID=A0ABR0ULN4_REHGL
MDKSEIGKNGDGFIDRSKVRILLCDNDERSSEESPRQVIDALNAEGPDIDIILSEVDLPMSKGLKMLKYIMRDKELRRIPLGLAEKNIVSYDFDVAVSDPSDANTNSTTLFSDDTDDKTRKSTNPETCVSTHQENETNATTTAAPIKTVSGAPSGFQPDVPGLIDRQRGQISPFPKKSELKIGGSSAFFTYVKSTTPKSSNSHGPSSVHENAPQQQKVLEHLSLVSNQARTNIRGQDNRESMENHSQADEHPRTNSIPNSFSTERSSTPPISLDISHQRQSKEAHFQLRNDSPNDVTGSYMHSAYPYYMPGVMNHVAMQQTANKHHKNLPDMLSHSNPSAIMAQYSHISQCSPHIPGMASYPYYPYGICLQPGQMPAPHPWPSFGNSSNEGKLVKVDRREAALMKFRQKRKERCFDKKIRYVNRKKLAERRPRLRGQFVRKVNGVNVDLNGHPASAEDDEEEEEDYDEDDQSNMDFLPEDDASECQQ